MVKNTNDRFPYGLSILIIGLLYLLDKTGVLSHIPYGDKLVSLGSIFLLIGIIFLCTKPDKRLGWVLTGIGVIINSDFFFGWMHSYSSLIVPILLIIVGLIMVLTSRK